MHQNPTIMQKLTKGSLRIVSIFFSARTVNSANNVLRTNSPGVTSDAAADVCRSGGCPHGKTKPFSTALEALPSSETRD
jgi:hypothetical protein